VTAKRRCGRDHQAPWQLSSQRSPPPSEPGRPAWAGGPDRRNDPARQHRDEPPRPSDSDQPASPSCGLLRRHANGCRLVADCSSSRRAHAELPFDPWSEHPGASSSERRRRSAHEKSPSLPWSFRQRVSRDSHPSHPDPSALPGSSVCPRSPSPLRRHAPRSPRGPGGQTTSRSCHGTPFGVPSARSRNRRPLPTGDPCGRLTSAMSAARARWYRGPTDAPHASATRADPPRTLHYANEAPDKRELHSKKLRRRPTLPRGCPPSTIGAGELNFRVRNGNGCDSAAMATGNLCALSTNLLAS
jgi:hypothetical protein